MAAFAHLADDDLVINVDHVAYLSLEDDVDGEHKVELALVSPSTTWTWSDLSRRAANDKFRQIREALTKAGA